MICARGVQRRSRVCKGSLGADRIGREVCQVKKLVAGDVILEEMSRPCSSEAAGFSWPG